MQNTVLTSKKRLSALLIATVFIFLCIFLRLAYIQVVWGKDLQSRAQDQWNRDLPLSAMRGDIVDTNGVVIATSVTAYSVYVRPKSITDPVKVAEVLSSALHIDYQIIYDKATRKGVSDITISRQVAYDVANTIRSANLNGVYLSSESAREYVYGNFLSQVLGFVSVDNVGQTGLEAYYNKYLTGINGKLLTQSDLIGKELSGEPMEYIPATDGLDVVLTIDYVIQSYVEQALDVIMQAYSPKNAKCLVIDVTNGDVLAMCVKPSVNLNNIDRSDVGLLMELSRNSLVTDIYEPGSTFKVVTTAATLEESLKGNKKAFDENYVFRNNSRTRIINGSKISCWSTHANGKHANQTISQALNNSCNPIFTDIALSLGAETFYEYLEKFGYGKPTGIDFSGEQSGILISKNSVTAGDLARIGFGQSVTVTAIQLAMATSAAVNGGLLYQPRLVKAIVDKSTKLVAKDFEPTVTNRAISVETSKKIAKMLQGVVTDGSGKKAYIQGYEVGGKTGTAQKFENGKLAEGKYVSSFVTFFPASSPKYLALILVDEPEGASYGSVVAAPFGKSIFEHIISYKNIPPLS